MNVSARGALGCCRCRLRTQPDQLTLSSLLRWLPSSSLRLFHSHYSASVAATANQQALLASPNRCLSTLASARTQDAPSTSDYSVAGADSPSTDTASSASGLSVTMDELRVTLRHAILSTASLLALVQHVRSERSLVDALTPSDYSLVCHHLSLHNAAHSDYRALTCLTLMDVYDEYCTRESNGEGEGWGEGWRRELMLDALTVCSRTGEGKGCEFVALGMSRYGMALTSREMNTVLWGWRFNWSKQWLWYETMLQLSAALAASEQPTDSDPRLLAFYHALQGSAVTRDGSRWRPDSVSVLIMMHSCSLGGAWQDDGFRRLDEDVLRRLSTSAFYLPAAAATTAHLLNQLISLSFVIDRNQPRRFARRVQSLFRLAAELQCTLTERSLRAAMAAAHILKHRQAEFNSVMNATRDDEQPSDATVDSSAYSGVQHDPDGARLAADVLAALQRCGASAGPSSALYFDLHADGSTPWQRVLELFDWVRQEGGHIDMQRALTATEACYRGRHWQRALDILVLPKWARKFINHNAAAQTAKTRSRHSHEQTRAIGGDGVRSEDAKTSATSESAVSDAPIEWIASKQRWSGRQLDRLVWLVELQDEPWLKLTPTLVSHTSPAAEQAESETDAAFSIPSAVGLAPTIPRLSPSPLFAPLSYPCTLLHVAYAIAAMDEASNAEAVLKADRLHVATLRLQPFIGRLYHYDSNTLHLHHPLLELHAARSFVQQPANQPAKLFSLLYLAWRTMRRRFVDNSLPLELQRVGFHYGSRGAKRWGVLAEAKELRRDPLRFRVDSEAEVAVLRRVLTQPPFGLHTRKNGQLGDVKRYKLWQLAGNRPAKSRTEHPPIDSVWWEAMHGAQRMGQEVITLELPSYLWHGAMHRPQ